VLTHNLFPLVTIVTPQTKLLFSFKRNRQKEWIMTGIVFARKKDLLTNEGNIMLLSTLTLAATLSTNPNELNAEINKLHDTGGIIIINPKKKEKRKLYDTGGIIIIQPKKKER